METEDPDFVEFINFLDGARSVPSVQQQKRIIFELLALQPGEKVLDIGCGTGDDVRDMAQLVGPDGWCVGVDQAGGMIEVARKRSRGKSQPVEFQQGTIYTLNFPENTFDVTRSERLFEHLQQPKQALAEMIRVTRAGGRILVASPDMDTNMIDHPNCSVTRRIRHFESDRRPNGLAGHKLYGLFWDAELTDLQVRVVVHINTSCEEMLSFLDIQERAEAARDGGAISESECAAWLEQLAHAGRFFMSTNHYIVCGRKAS
jgi:SAM-dependent methyltransferase